MVAHIEERAGKLVIRMMVSRLAGMFTAEVSKSATPAELEIFFAEVKTIVRRRQQKEHNEAG